MTSNKVVLPAPEAPLSLLSNFGFGGESFEQLIKVVMN
jgi:hypothetical protein